MPAHKHIVRIGDPAPDFSLPSLDNGMVHLSDYRGKRTLLFMWASWELCRDQMVGWEAFYQRHKHEKFELLSVATDAGGAEKVRPFVEKARPSYKTLVDDTGAIWDLFGFELIPSGYYVDESGRVRYLKVGGFDVRDGTTVKIIDDLLAEKWSKNPIKFVEKTHPLIKQEMASLKRQLRTSSRNAEKRLRLADLMVELGHHRKAGKEYDTVLAQHPRHVKGLFSRGVLYAKGGKKEQALLCWRNALAQAPTNWIIHKQIWALEFPEQFYPSINFFWQQEQLRREEFLASTQQKAKAQSR